MLGKTRILTRAGIVAALYAALTLCTVSVAYSPLQIRLSECLTVLPVFFPESAYALFVGCVCSNVFSGYGVWDIVIGSLTTLAAGLLTRFIYRRTSNIFLAAVPPVILNAALVPISFVLAGADGGYLAGALSILVTQSVWVFGLGIPLFYVLKKPPFNF